MSMIQEIRLALRRMPLLLRWVTGMCLAFSLFLPAAILPFGEHRIDDQEVSFSEFWRQGGGPVFAGIGLLSISLAYGFIRATRWARLLAVMTGLAVTALAAFEARRFTWEILTMALLAGVGWPAYLLRHSGVRQYFGGGRKPAGGDRGPHARKPAMRPPTPGRR